MNLTIRQLNLISRAIIFKIEAIHATNNMFLLDKPNGWTEINSASQDLMDELIVIKSAIWLELDNRYAERLKNEQS